MMTTATEAAPDVQAAREHLEALIASGGSVDECIEAREVLDDAIASERDAMAKADRRLQISGDIARAKQAHATLENTKRLAAVDAEMLQRYTPVATISFAGQVVKITLGNLDPHSVLVGYEAVRRCLLHANESMQNARGSAREKGRVTTPKWDTARIELSEAKRIGLIEFTQEK